MLAAAFSHFRKAVQKMLPALLLGLAVPHPIAFVTERCRNGHANPPPWPTPGRRCYNGDGSANECYTHACAQTGGTLFYCERSDRQSAEVKSCTSTCVVGAAGCYLHKCHEHPQGHNATFVDYLCRPQARSSKRRMGVSNLR